MWLAVPAAELCDLLHQIFWSEPMRPSDSYRVPPRKLAQHAAVRNVCGVQVDVCDVHAYDSRAEAAMIRHAHGGGVEHLGAVPSHRPLWWRRKSMNSMDSGS